MTGPVVSKETADLAHVASEMGKLYRAANLRKHRPYAGQRVDTLSFRNPMFWHFRGYYLTQAAVKIIHAAERSGIDLMSDTPETARVWFEAWRDTPVTDADRMSPVIVGASEWRVVLTTPYLKWGRA